MIESLTRSHGALAGMYIHVPFCQTRCRYCDFTSTSDQSLRSRWLRALARERELYAENSWSSFDTLYLGGGTPSLLRARELEGILLGVEQSFAFCDVKEVTLEANPDDVTPELLHIWKNLGINRLSLGLQALDDATLRFLGRRHDSGSGRKAYLEARAAGFENISVDLIFGVPGQTLRSFGEELSRFLALGPEHLSCYQLTFEDSTPLGAARSRGEVTPLSCELERILFIEAHERLTSAGYDHYEVSNYAREVGAGAKTFRSQHNLKYWCGVPYLGFGPGAHSFDGARRWWNVSAPRDYIAALERDAGVPIADSEQLTREQTRLETLMLGFRTSAGVPLEVFADFPGGEETLHLLVNEGFVKLAGQRAVPTLDGLLVADSLPLRFL